MFVMYVPTLNLGSTEPKSCAARSAGSGTSASTSQWLLPCPAPRRHRRPIDDGDLMADFQDDPVREARARYEEADEQFRHAQQEHRRAQEALGAAESEHVRTVEALFSYSCCQVASSSL